jgi:hypothetical protein
LSNSAHPLKPFERLIGGEWHLDNSFQVFEWGVGKTSVKVKSYINTEGGAILVTEGMWFWHPADNKLKGSFTAIQMPVVYFDYETQVIENQFKHKIKTYTSVGELTEYQETWQFINDNAYEWTLLRKTDTGYIKDMTGTFKRHKSP